MFVKLGQMVRSTEWPMNLSVKPFDVMARIAQVWTVICSSAFG